MASALTALGERLAGIELAALSAEVVEAARKRVFDTLACFVAGAASPEGQALGRLAQTGLPERIRYVCGATRCTEVDDIHIPSCTTIGSVVVPPLLLSAAQRQAADADLLCALVAGYEAMARFGMAIDGALRIYEGVWSTYVSTPLTVAAALARLGRFGAERTGHALAIGAMRSTGITGRTAGPNGSRWFAAGSAAMDGYWAAEAAGAGLVGDLSILDGAFTRATGVEVNVERLAADGWTVLDIDAKPFRTSRQALSATEAFRQASQGRPPEEITGVQAWVPGQVLAMVNNPSFGLGVQRQIALAAVDPAALWDVAEARPAVEHALQLLVTKVRVAEDPKLTALYPQQWGGRVDARFTDGSTSQAEVLDPPGSARAPFSWDDLLRKHQAIAQASRLPAGWLEPALEVCHALGAGSSAATLIDMLPV